MPIFFVDVRQEVFQCIQLALTSRPTHFEGQTSPEVSIPLIVTIFMGYINHFLDYPDSDVKNATFFCGRPSRPCRCIRLALTARLTHFEGQTSLEVSIPIILMIFVCYRKQFFG